MDPATYLKNNEPPESKHPDQLEFGSERIQFHKRHPEVSIDQYRSRILHEFGKLVSKRKIVYLDLNYWIDLPNR